MDVATNVHGRSTSTNVHGRLVSDLTKKNAWNNGVKSHQFCCYTGGTETGTEHDRAEHHRCTKNNERQDNCIIPSSVILMVMMIW